MIQALMLFFCMFSFLLSKPVRNYNEWMIAYSLSFMILSMFLMDLFIGIMAETFYKCEKKLRQGDIQVNEDEEDPESGKRHWHRKEIIHRFEAPLDQSHREYLENRRTVQYTQNAEHIDRIIVIHNKVCLQSGVSFKSSSGQKHWFTSTSWCLRAILKLEQL